MGKIVEKIINRFDGGMATTPHSKNPSQYYHTKHFKVFPNKLEPQFGSTDKSLGDEYAAAITKPFKFIYATGANGDALFGLCKTSSSRFLILEWLNDTSVWDNPTGGIDTTGGTVCNDVFFAYNSTAYYAYVFLGGTTLGRYDLAAGTAFNNNYQTVQTFTASSSIDGSEICQPVVHPVTDHAYFFAKHKAYRLSRADSWAAMSLALPSTTYIAAAIPYGKYMVMALRHDVGLKTTIVFWDLDESRTTVNFSYEMDNRDVRQLRVIRGRLMVLSTDYRNIYSDVYTGSEFRTVNTLEGVRSTARATSTEVQLSKDGIIINEKLYFIANYDVPGYDNSYNTRLGIWSMDRDGRFDLAYLISGATSYEGLAYIFDNLWVAHSSTSVARLDITYSTSLASVYETALQGDAYRDKKLMSVGVATEPLPANGQIVLKYRLKENADWTTIYTHTTDGEQYHEAINIESGGTALPTFRKIQFRVESIGGAVPLEVKFKYEELDNNLT